MNDERPGYEWAIVFDVLMADNAELRTRLRSAEAHIDRIKEQCADIEAENVELSGENADLAAQLEGTRRQVIEANRRYENLKAHINTVNASSAVAK